MAIFAVTYDLNHQKDYEALWDAFDALDSHKAAQSFYFVSSNTSTKGLFDHLNQYIDQDDTLIVVQVGSAPWFKRAMKGTLDWVKRFFSY